MATTSFAFGDSYGLDNHHTFDDRDYDDSHTTEDYDRKQAERDGWKTVTWDGRF